MLAICYCTYVANYFSFCCFSNLLMNACLFGCAVGQASTILFLLHVEWDAMIRSSSIPTGGRSCQSNQQQEKKHSKKIKCVFTVVLIVNAQKDRLFHLPDPADLLMRLTLSVEHTIISAIFFKCCTWYAYHPVYHTPDTTSTVQFWLWHFPFSME